MSKIETISRQHLIIKTLQKRACSFKELQISIEREFKLLGYDLKMGIKTFQRDVQDILSMYKLEVLYNRSNNKYYIDGEINQITEKIFESFETTNILKLSEELPKYISFDKRKFKGKTHLNNLLCAIKNNLTIKFNHQKHGEKITERTVNPLALKECEGWWYLIAKTGDRISSFGLDRISEIEITNQKFRYPTEYNIEKAFEYAYGIITIYNKEPSKVELSYTPYQGKFIQSLPLHHSQQIIIDNDKEFRIRLTIHITHDFVMKLLSYGESLKVIKPKSLINEIKDIYQNAIKQY